MKQIVLIALLGNYSAIKLNHKLDNSINEGFIDGDFEIQDDDSTLVKTTHSTKSKKKHSPKNHEKLSVKSENMEGSDPIWGSLGPDDKTDDDFQTEEGIIERDLRARKPARFVLDPDEHPETQDSIEWAEKAIGSKLTPPKRTAFEIEMDKLDQDHQFNYETEQDQDITDTLANAKLAESQINSGHRGWGYGGYGGYGNGHHGYYGGNHDDRDWWTGLIKDNGKEGMISTNAKANRYRDYYYGRYHNKGYDSLAAEYVSARESKIAKEKQAKMSAKDKEAAKDLKKATEGDDKKDEDKKEDTDEKGEDTDKKEEKKDGDSDSKEENGDDSPPELKKPEKPKALSQKKRSKKKRSKKQQKHSDDQETDDSMFERNKAGKDIIDIGGEKIVLGTLGEEDLQVDEELRSQDLIEYIQTDDLQDDDEFVQLQLSNQEKLERVIRSGI